MSDVEVEEVVFFMCPSQAYEGLINYQSKEGKRLYVLASVKLLNNSMKCNTNEYHNLGIMDIPKRVVQNWQRPCSSCQQ
jgi:hypothetical protein